MSDREDAEVEPPIVLSTEAGTRLVATIDQDLCQAALDRALKQCRHLMRLLDKERARADALATALRAIVEDDGAGEGLYTAGRVALSEYGEAREGQS